MNRRRLRQKWEPLERVGCGEIIARVGSLDKVPPFVDEVWMNDLVLVQVNRSHYVDEWGIETDHLFVVSTDRKPIRKWGWLQRVKNEVVGPQRQAVEMFPKESELVDVGDVYHLWVLPEGRELPFNFEG